jgi:hypothetical protein
MHSRITALAALLAVGIAFAQTPPADGGRTTRETSWPPIAEGKWSGKRLRDGQPDVEGSYSNTIGNHSSWANPPEGGASSDTQAGDGARGARRPSRVTDPADGRIPYQPWARAKQQEFVANFANPTKPQYIEPFARCAPGGALKSFAWHGFEIRQFPGYLLLLFDSGTRVIHLDGRPHLPANISLWNADSRGHWEGNTLVVSVRNSNGKALLGRQGDFIGPDAQIDERYVFAADGGRFNYIARVTDPETFTRPWTTTIPVRRYTEKDKPDNWNYWVTPANLPGKPRIDEHVERICVENNGPFGGGAVGVPGQEVLIAR